MPNIRDEIFDAMFTNRHVFYSDLIMMKLFENDEIAEKRWKRLLKIVSYMKSRYDTEVAFVPLAISKPNAEGNRNWWMDYPIDFSILKCMIHEESENFIVVIMKIDENDDYMPNEPVFIQHQLGRRETKAMTKKMKSCDFIDWDGSTYTSPQIHLVDYSETLETSDSDMSESSS